MNVTRHSFLLAAVLAANVVPGIAGVAAAGNQPPPPPELVSPQHGTIAPLLRPSLVIENATDPDGDPLVYSWDLARDVVFAMIAESGTGAPAPGTTLTTFELSADLVEDTRHCWRVRSDDGQATSGYNVACFLVSAQNDPPSVPVLRNPSDNMGATTTTPVFSWQPSTDPEDESITYAIEVKDPAGTLVGAVSGVTGTVTSISSELDNGATYTWRAQALDRSGAMSAFSPDNTFSVNAPLYCPEITVRDEGGCSGGCSGDDHGYQCQASRAPSAGSAVALGIGLVGFLGLRRRRRRR